MFKFLIYLPLTKIERTKHSDYFSKFVPLSEKISYAFFSMIILELGLCSSSYAEPVLAIAGSQYSANSTYSYVGFVQPLKNAELGSGWYRKVFTSYLTYNYKDSASGSEIKASAPGIEGGFGHAWKAEKWNIDLSATLGYRHINLSPFAPINDKKGNVITLNPMVQARYRFNQKLDFDIIATHSLGHSNSYSRERLGWTSSSGMRFGPELIQAIGSNYHNSQYGVFAGIPLKNGTWFELSTGRSQARDGGSSAYIAIGLAKVF
jgi:hypothetical protein